MFIFLKSSHFAVVKSYSGIHAFVLTLLALTLLSCDGQKKKDAADFFLKANVAFTEKNYAEALRLYDEAISKNSEFSDAYLNKGICLMKLNKPEEAYEVLTGAIKIDPTLIQAILVRAEAGLLLGKLSESEDDLKTIKKEYKDSSRYYLLHGNLMEAKNQTAESLADYNQAVLLNKANVEALVNRGAIYYKLKSYNLAEEDFTRAVKLNPSQPEALNNLGLISIKNNNWKEAVAYFDIILDSDPANPLALNNKGFALLKIGKLEEAVKLINRSIDIMPSNGYALRNIGIYYQYKNDINNAIIAFEKAIDLAEPVDDLYGLTGKAHMVAGNKLSACKTWKQGSMLKDSISIAEFEKNCK